jgi:O-antigen ligase
MKSDPVADALWAATLATSPLVGVGVIRLVSGADLGAGLQPAYLTLALAWTWRLGRLLDPARRRDLLDDLALPARRKVWLVLAAGCLAVLLSAIGLRHAPAPVVPAEAWPRYGRQVVQLLIMLAFTLYAWLWTRGTRRWRFTGLWLAAGLAGTGLYALLQAWHVTGGLPGLAGWERVVTSNPAILSGSEQLYLGGFTGIPRLRGTMCEPLYLGSFLLACAPVLAATGRRLWALAAVVLLAATWSRGAWLALVVTVTFWGLARARARLPLPGRRALLVAVGLVAVLLIVALAVAGPASILLPVRRLTQTLDAGDWSNLTRLYSAQAAWRAFTLSPLVGVGWGQFPFHFYALVDVTGLHSQFQWPVVNSIPLLVLGETGLAGALVLLGGVVLGARASWRALGDVDADPARRARVAALTAAMAGLATHLLVFSQYNLPHLWFVPGLWLAALHEVHTAARPGREERS